MDLLWRNAPSHLARHSLAQALSVLKEKVGREHLVVQRATVALAEGPVQADVARTVGSGRAHVCALLTGVYRLRPLAGGKKATGVAPPLSPGSPLVAAGRATARVVR